MQPNILRNHTVTDDEWAVVSSLFPPEPASSVLGGRPRYCNRAIFQALLYWLADGLAKRRLNLKQYVGISYDTLARRLDAWIDAGVFEGLWFAALANQDEVCGLRTSWLLVDGRLGAAPSTWLGSATRASVRPARSGWPPGFKPEGLRKLLGAGFVNMSDDGGLDELRELRRTFISASSARSPATSADNRSQLGQEGTRRHLRVR